jgi:hypothetical protein
MPPAFVYLRGFYFASPTKSLPHCSLRQATITRADPSLIKQTMQTIIKFCAEAPGKSHPSVSYPDIIHPKRPGGTAILQLHDHHMNLPLRIWQTQLNRSALQLVSMSEVLLRNWDGSRIFHVKSLPNWH